MKIILLALLAVGICVSPANEADQKKRRPRAVGLENILIELQRSIAEGNGENFDLKEARAIAKKLAEEDRWRRQNPEKAKLRDELMAQFFIAASAISDANAAADDGMRRKHIQKAQKILKTIKKKDPTWEEELINRHLRLAARLLNAEQDGADQPAAEQKPKAE